MKTRIVKVGIIIGALVHCQISLSADPAPERIKSISVDVEAITETGQIKLTNYPSPFVIGPDAGMKQLNAKLKAGDRVGVTFDNNDPTQAIASINSVARQASRKERFVALILALIVPLAFACWASNWAPLNFIIGQDKRYSNSKFQAVVWFNAVITVYLAMLGLRVYFGGLNLVVGLDIPGNLLMLSGLSALTYGGAKAVTVQKQANAQATVAAAREKGQPVDQISIKEEGAPNFPENLFQGDDGQLDLGDSESVFITLLAVFVFLFASFAWLEWVEILNNWSLPDVDGTLLATFGLGQGAYLTKKAVSLPGNVPPVK